MNNHKLFIHSTVDGHWGCFQTGAFTNHVAENSQVLISTSARFRPGHGSVGSQGCVCPTVVNTARFLGCCENRVFVFFEMSAVTMGIEVADWG